MKQLAGLVLAGVLAVGVPVAHAQEPAAPSVDGTRPQAVNVHLEFTIIDIVGDEAPRRKVVSMLAADQTMGRVRAANQSGPDSDLQLNIDARPSLLGDGRIRVEMTVQHNSPGGGATTEERYRPTTLNESLVVFLRPGEATAVSQAADPVSNRRISVEVKATVRK
ncbi:MAG: hypothetical protein AB7H88_11925 [Vicinamibacterales bacterium]